MFNLNLEFRVIDIIVLVMWKDWNQTLFMNSWCFEGGCLLGCCAV
jgi:hypothetical protein